MLKIKQGIFANYKKIFELLSHLKISKKSNLYVFCQTLKPKKVMFARLPRSNIYQAIKSIPKEQILEKSETGYFCKVQKKFEQRKIGKTIESM